MIRNSYMIGNLSQQLVNAMTLNNTEHFELRLDEAQV